MNKKISPLLGIIILLIVGAAAIGVFAYYFQYQPIPFVDLLPDKTPQVEEEAEFFSVDGQVIDIKKKSLIFEGFSFPLTEKSKFKKYNILINAETEIIRILPDQDPPKETAFFQEIEIDHRLVVYADSNISGKSKFTAKKIEILTNDYINGEVTKIEGEMISLENYGLLGRPKLSTPETYQILVNDQTQFIVLDYSMVQQKTTEDQVKDTSDLPKPIQKTGSFKDIKVDSNIIAYADKNIAKEIKRFTAVKIQIIKLPSFAVQ